MIKGADSVNFYWSKTYCPFHNQLRKEVEAKVDI
jgi:hypothetical protein